jgi:glutathione S-transferase/RNA polymerase-associated protein
MSMILFEHPLSPYAQKVKIALREKGLAFEARLPAGVGPGGAGTDFTDISPFAEVPALVDGAVSVFDSTIILEYLEEAYPKPDLLPDFAPLAAKARMIEEVMDTRYEAINWAMYEVGVFKRADGQKAEELAAAARRQLAGLHAWLERQLNGKAWFCPPHFGWADLCVVPFVAAARANGMGPEAGSALAEWLDRALARPSVAKTVEEARAALGGFPRVADAVKAGAFKRLYRDHRLEWMLRSGGAEIVLAGMEAGNIRFGAELE